MALPSLADNTLRPGDVLFMGVFGVECEDRLFSDVISCFNSWGKLAMPERFDGVSCALACHVALYVGEGRFVHATGPGATFLVTVDELDAYLAQHPRLVTALRCADEGFAADAASIGRALAKAPDNVREFQGAALVWDLILQGMFPGRRDDQMLRGFRRALRSGEGCLRATPCVVSCGAFVGTILRLAAGSGERASLVGAMPCDISPFEMLVMLLQHPRWQVAARHQPLGLEQSVGAPLATTTPRRQGKPGARWTDLPLLLAALVSLPAIIAVFFAGFGRDLQAMLFARTATRGARPAARLVRGDEDMSPLSLRA